MSIEAAILLHIRLKQALEDLRTAHEDAVGIDWFVQSPAAPHLDSAAQSLFVALNRLEKTAIGVYGADVWKELVPASDTQDA